MFDWRRFTYEYLNPEITCLLLALAGGLLTAGGLVDWSVGYGWVVASLWCTAFTKWVRGVTLAEKRRDFDDDVIDVDAKVVETEGRR